MDCTLNDFCRQLPASSRKKLCAKCRRRLFMAGSIQMRDDCLQNCMLVLDGAFVSSPDLAGVTLDHDIDLPSLYLGIPGRLLNLDITFGYEEIQPAIAYAEFHYLTDTWVASFSHHVIRELCDEDADFRHAVMRNMVQTTADACQTAALFRSNYTYPGLYHLVGILAKRGLYLSQQQLAELMNHDRTSISKAFSRLKKEHPDRWEAYVKNKKRELTKPVPGGK